jgi:hypothetical protein
MRAIIVNEQPKYESQFKVILSSEGAKTYTSGATDEQWVDWGFKEVVEAVYDVATQNLGAWIETETTITREVIAKTVEEIAEYDAQQVVIAQRVLDNDASAVIERKFRQDGEVEYDRIKYRLKRAVADTFITPQEFTAIKKVLSPTLYPMNFGDWDLAKINVDAINDTNLAANLLTILNIVKGILNDYILENGI